MGKVPLNLQEANLDQALRDPFEINSQAFVSLPSPSLLGAEIKTNSSRPCLAAKDEMTPSKNH